MNLFQTKESVDAANSALDRAADLGAGAWFSLLFILWVTFVAIGFVWVFVRPMMEQTRVESAARVQALEALVGSMSLIADNDKHVGELLSKISESVVHSSKLTEDVVNFLREKNSKFSIEVLVSSQKALIAYALERMPENSPARESLVAAEQDLVLWQRNWR